MKSKPSSTDSVRIAAFMLDGIGRSSDVTEALLPHAKTLATNIDLYATMAPQTILDSSFLLLGCFQPLSPEYRNVRSFLDRRVAEHTVEPMARAAEAAMYSGPKRPDSESREAAGFVVEILPALTGKDRQAGFNAGVAVLMHSDSRPSQRLASGHFAKQQVLEDLDNGNVMDASQKARLSIVAGGKLTPPTEDLIDIQMSNIDKIAAESTRRACFSAATVLLYAREHGPEIRKAEYLLVETWAQRAKAGDHESAVALAWTLLLTGDQSRTPYKISRQYLETAKPDFLPAKQRELEQLFAASPEQREMSVQAERKSQRNALRGVLARKVLPGPVSASDGPRLN